MRPVKAVRKYLIRFIPSFQHMPFQMYCVYANSILCLDSVQCLGAIGLSADGC